MRTVAASALVAFVGEGQECVCVCVRKRERDRVVAWGSVQEKSLTHYSSSPDHLEPVLIRQLQKVPTSLNMDIHHNEIHGLLLQASALLAANHFR